MLLVLFLYVVSVLQSVVRRESPLSPPDDVDFVEHATFRVVGSQELQAPIDLYA